MTSEKADYAFLSLKTSAFDLTDRGVAGRAVPAGADAFVYAERGVYRSTETVDLTALLRAVQGHALSVRPQPPVHPPPRPGPIRGGVDWGEFVGVKLFAWSGGFVLFLGIVFLVKYSF